MTTALKRFMPLRQVLGQVLGTHRYPASAVGSVTTWKLGGQRPPTTPVSSTGAIPSSPKIGQTPPASAPTLGQKDSVGVQPAARPSPPDSIKIATSDFMSRMMG